MINVYRPALQAKAATYQATEYLDQKARKVARAVEVAAAAVQMAYNLAAGQRIEMHEQKVMQRASEAVKQHDGNAAIDRLHGRMSWCISRYELL